MSLSMSSSAKSSSPSLEQYGGSPPAAENLIALSSAFFTLAPSFASAHTSQMPSPAEPRFCLITRGWNAHVLRMPSGPTKCAHLPVGSPKYVYVSGRPHERWPMFVSASFAPICVCTPGDDH